MLKKCLKYDMRASWRIWLILSILVLSLSVVGGFAVAGMGSDNPFVSMISALTMMPAMVSLVAYPIAMSIIVGVRCYTNFYTDEGYLTFTLPVRRRTHLHSKLISAGIFMGSSILVDLVAILIIAEIASLFEGGNAIVEIFGGIGNLFGMLIADGGFHGVMVIILSILAILLFGACMLLWFYFAITFGAMAARRLKLLAIIATVYISEMIFNAIFTVNFFLVALVISGIAEGLGSILTAGEMEAMIWLSLLILCAVLATVASLFYRYIVSRLEKNLNLA